MFVLIKYVSIYAMCIISILSNCRLNIFYLYLKRPGSARLVLYGPFVIESKIVLSCLDGRVVRAVNTYLGKLG